ncbi:NADH-quinone oxidoreductase subunit J [Shewanella sp. UCD-KL12]|uniref:NADH-quinone oxidoreductase subunit J n=1 Tax=Shewanella sp. UCD-KL12 TaxID=1917163 RepID=UPI000970876C|nr:NADH-quinone oxidoreductase subunit J [Shewanella sp. UCD-KL12]
MNELIFLLTATIAIVAALITVTSHNIVHALLYLVTMMLAVALIFFLLGSPFAAALQIIVYAGAIMVLFVFVTMMLHQGEHSLSSERKLFSTKAAMGPLILSSILVIELLVISMGAVGLHTETLINSVSVKQLAIALFGRYQALVVLSAVLLLAALVSAIHITKRQFGKGQYSKNQLEVNHSHQPGEASTVKAGFVKADHAPIKIVSSLDSTNLNTIDTINTGSKR